MVDQAEAPSRDTAAEEAREPRGSSGHSGRLLLRMPPSLHAELARAADTEGISLNQFITTALASSVGWRNEAGEDAQPDGSANGQPAAAVEESPPRSRGRSLLLVLNLIVLIVVAVLAVVLLVAAYQS